MKTAACQDCVSAAHAHVAAAAPCHRLGLTRLYLLYVCLNWGRGGTDSCLVVLVLIACRHLLESVLLLGQGQSLACKRML